MLQQQLSDSPALMGVLDQESHFSMIIFDSVVASDRDHVLPEGDDKRHAIHIVHLSEPPNVPISQPRIRREEAEVFRLWGDPFIEGDKSVCIGGPDRAQMGNAAV